jgi:hypothetical protein
MPKKSVVFETVENRNAYVRLIGVLRNHHASLELGYQWPGISINNFTSTTMTLNDYNMDLLSPLHREVLTAALADWLV